MARIRVDLADIETIRTLLYRQAQTMQNVSNTIGRANSGLDMKVAAAADISRAVSNLQRRTANEERLLEGLAGALTRVTDDFIRTDQRISRKAKDVQYLLDHAGMDANGGGRIPTPLATHFLQRLSELFGIDLDGYSTTASVMMTIDGLIEKHKNEGYSEKWARVLKVLGKCGAIGGFASALGGLAIGTVEGDVKRTVKAVPDIMKWAGSTGAKIVDKNLIDIWGTNTVDAIGFRENIAKQLDDYVFNSSHNIVNKTAAAKTAHNLGAIAKWGGVAISGACNFVENVDEYGGDLSNYKVYAETLGETAIDVGLGVLVTAGVGALAGATAPVWAVGAVSAGIIMLADDLNVTEIVSDAAITVVETVGETIGDLGKAAANAIGDAVNATADFASAGWKKLTSIF